MGFAKVRERSTEVVQSFDTTLGSAAPALDFTLAISELYHETSYIHLKSTYEYFQNFRMSEGL